MFKEFKEYVLKGNVPEPGDTTIIHSKEVVT